MTQTRLHSFYESLANTGVGFVVSLFVQGFVNWWYDLPLNFGQSVSIIVLFTIASVIRNYVMRRYFNNFHTRKIIKEN